MIYRTTSSNHERAIGALAIFWSSHLLLRILLLPAAAFVGFWGMIIIVASAATGHSGFILPALVFVALAALFALDVIVECRTVNHDIDQYGDKATQVSRALYLGGHPDLPDPRYVYFRLAGFGDNPEVSITFPFREFDYTFVSEDYPMPLLDLILMREGQDELHDALASIVDAQSGVVRRRQPTLKVRFTGPTGRPHEVELTNFYSGAGELRRWRNYLVCAQSEAETGEPPRGPWRSLPANPAPTSTPQLAPVATSRFARGVK